MEKYSRVIRFPLFSRGKKIRSVSSSKTHLG